MNRQAFDRYLKHFNEQDYEGVKALWVEQSRVSFAGYTFTSRDTFLNFYKFFHEFVDERISVRTFLSGGANLFIEADVSLRAKKDLTPEILASAGYDKLFPLTKGVTLIVPQYILYELHDGKQFRSVNCVVAAEPYMA